MTDIKPIKLTPAEIRHALKAEAQKYTASRLWEPWEDELIREFFGKVPIRIIGEKIGRTEAQVGHRVKLLGVRTRHLPGAFVKTQPKKMQPIS